MRRSILEPRWLSYGFGLGMLLMAGWVYLSNVPADQAPPIPPGFRVDVNHADVRALAALPGLGPTTAQRIIDSRQEHGRFAVPADLIRIHGIGARTVEVLQPWISFGPGVGPGVTLDGSADSADKDSGPFDGPLLEESSSSLPVELTP